MAVVLEGTQTTSFTSGTSLTIALPAGVVENDLILIAGVHEGAFALSTPTGYTQLVDEQATDAYFGTNLCRFFVFYKIATSSESNPVTSSTDNASDKRFIVHRFSGCNTGQPLVLRGSGQDNVKKYQTPGFPPYFNIASCTTDSFDDELFRIAACNDNGDEGTLDNAQSFTGHTRRAILTGSEVGMISIQKNSVSAETVGALQIDTISVVGGEVDAIAFANIALREGTAGGGGGRSMMLLGVG